MSQKDIKDLMMIILKSFDLKPKQQTIYKRIIDEASTRQTQYRDKRQFFDATKSSDDKKRVLLNKYIQICKSQRQNADIRYRLQELVNLARQKHNELWYVPFWDPDKRIMMINNAYEHIISRFASQDREKRKKQFHDMIRRLQTEGTKAEAQKQFEKTVRQVAPKKMQIIQRNIQRRIETGNIYKNHREFMNENELNPYDERFILINLVITLGHKQKKKQKQELMYYAS